ncbi:S49 family peptidase, partial [Cronobacter sakazakii]
GENTEEGREKFREDLNETHHLFKEFVHSMRPSLDIDAVATGEHWYGVQAKEKGLVDEISTSDDLIIARMAEREVVSLRYMQRKRLMDRFTGSAAQSLDRLLLRWWQRGQKPLL